jgi:hypothetical protein
MNVREPIERRIQAIRIPEIDVSEKVMARLESRERTTRGWGLRRRWVLACAAVLFVLGTGYASATWIELLQQDGRPAMVVQTFDSDNPEPIARKLAETYLSKIAPGEAIAVYDPSAGDRVSVLEKPIVYDRFDRLRSAVNGAFPLPETLPADVSLREGRVYHELEHPDIGMLEEQSRLNGGQAAYAAVQVKESPVGLALILSHAGREYSVTMGEGRVWSTIHTDLNRKKETRVVNIRGTEGLMAISQDEAVLHWRSPRELGDVYYRISTAPGAEQLDAVLASVLERLLPHVE